MRLLIAAVLCLFFACSCSRIPEPTGFEYSTQSKLQAAHHWDVLALDIANQINNELLKDDLLSTAVYVKKTCGEDDAPCKENETTQFDEAFHDLLLTELVRFGIPTCAQPEQGAITINYKVQTVYHQADRFRTLAPGVITGLTAAVQVLRNAPSQAVAIATAGALDFANSAYVRSGHYEVIITTSMVSMRKYLFRSSNIYYINDADFWHYKASYGKAKKIHMTDSSFAVHTSRWEPPPMEKPEPHTPDIQNEPKSTTSKPGDSKPPEKILPQPIRDI